MKNTDKTITTKFDENIFSTSDISKMEGMYLAQRLTRKWNEDFVDEDTGEVVSIERNELIFDKGTKITKNVLSEINFFLESKDIHEVDISDQSRPGISKIGMASVWSASISVSSKKRTYLFYANSLKLAHSIILDYLEQNVEGGFVFCNIKELDYSNLIPTNEGGEYFYNIELEIENMESTYIINANDAEAAKEKIKIHLASNGTTDCEAIIISAKKINCFGIVGYKFSEKYIENTNGNQ